MKRKVSKIKPTKPQLNIRRGIMAQFIFSTFYLILLLLPSTTFAQVGTTFWFAAPDVEDYNAPEDRPIALILTGLDKTATVSINQPKNPGFSTLTVNVAANSTEIVDLTPYIDSIECKGTDTITGRGILITSTENIIATYTHYDATNPEMYSLKGDNALGKEFILPCQNVGPNIGPPYYAPSAFYIVASENGTTVTITPSNDLAGHSAGTPYSISLDRGEVYIGEANGSQAADHFGGTLVEADKPVAITIESFTSLSPCTDTNGDQIVPTSLGGMQFIVLEGSLNFMGNSDYVFIYPTEDNTTISIDGTSVGSYNKGAFYRHNNPTSSPLTIVTADKNVLVYQVAGAQTCESGGAVIPPASCSGSTAVPVSKTDPVSLIFISVLVQDGGEGRFLVDGDSTIITSSNFSSVSGVPGWKQAYINVTNDIAAGGAILITNDLPFHIGVTEITAGGTKYGFFSNFGEFKPSLAVAENLNDKTADLSTDFVASTYQWYYSVSPDSTFQPIMGATTTSYTATEQGYYYLECTYGANCTVTTGTYRLSFIPTMSEWALILFFLILLSLGTVLIMKRNLILADPTGNLVAFDLNEGLLGLPFEGSTFVRGFALAAGLGLGLAIVSILTTGILTMTDLAGGLLALPVLGYWIHLLLPKGKK